MIKIVPNILSSSNEDFTTQLSRLESFESIDIDICEAPFTLKNSVNVSTAIDLLSLCDKNLSFHLMMHNPIESLALLNKSNLKIETVFIHQESNIVGLENQNYKFSIGITVKRESRLKDLSFYNKYNSVQLMTGTFGGQGLEFDEESLSKSLLLRDMGFTKEVGIDGGVNLNTAKIIKDYPIDRVSVGSFIHKSKNPQLDSMKLTLALNMRNIEESF